MDDRCAPAQLAAVLPRVVADHAPGDRELLDATVRLARMMFSGAASSILLHDRESSQLVFAAVSGQGEESLVGRRFPAVKGVAGWVLASGEPMAVADLATSEIFARDVAESTDYVPDSLLAAPLLCDGEALGVLEILDPRSPTRCGLADLDLLTALGQQAALSLRALIGGRTVGSQMPADSHSGGSQP